MKAYCAHGRPWFGPCVDCEADRVAAVDSGLPFWRDMSPWEAQSFARKMSAQAWREQRFIERLERNG